MKAYNVLLLSERRRQARLWQARRRAAGRLVLALSVVSWVVYLVAV